MIVISGALVLVALVLLVIGIVGPTLAFVYASIAVSLVSLVFLVIGIRQRRDEVLPGQSTTPGPGAEVPSTTAGTETVSSPTVTTPGDGPRADLVRSSADASDPVEGLAAVPGRTEPDEQVGLEQGGTVLVVAGRPRYHVEGCRYLTGKAAQPIEVLDALEEGFTPCGVCKPDTSLADLRAQGPDRPADENRHDGGQVAPAVGVAPVGRPYDAVAGDAVSGDVVSGDVVSDDAVSDDAAPDDAAPDDAVADSRRRDSGFQDSGFQDSGPQDSGLRDSGLGSEEFSGSGLGNDALPGGELPNAGLPDDSTPDREAERPGGGRGRVPVGAIVSSPAPATSGATPRRPVATARTAARASTRASTTAAVSDTPAARPTAASRPPRLAKAVPASRATPATRTSRTTPVTAAPAKTGPAATPAGPAATPARAARAGSVVVIPDRGRFHRAECRYVRGVGGATTMTKTAASKQGYDACGVCKP